MFRALVVGVVAAVAALPGSVLASVGVSYSPYHASEYYSNPGAIATLLDNDLQQIAAQGFSYVRTYHGQFYDTNVVPIAQKNGLQVAVGVQMLGSNGAEYEHLEQDIQAAIWAAKNLPESVMAIYVGNENLRASTADKIIEIITRIKSELKGTAGEATPVGTAQNLDAWINWADADKLAAASDVVGANIFPFFSHGAQLRMKETLAEQWKTFTDKYGARARLTETGWASESAFAPAGNNATVANAEKYFAAFVEWATESGAATPFYSTMYDWASAPGNDYDQHFGLASIGGVMKFSLNLAVTGVREGDGSAFETILPTEETPDSSSGSETLEPIFDTPEPSTETPEPTSDTPTITPAPTDEASESGSGSGSEEIVVPTQLVPSSDGSDGDAGVAPAPTRAPTRAPTAAPVPVPVVTTKSPEQQAAEEIAAKAKDARGVSGQTTGGFYIFGSAAAVLGVVAIAVIAVYMRRQSADEGETRTVAASSIDPRSSTPSSVYDDPLGTRFSSIVMITPNGDGVCIL